jgi:hypothetical protein
MPEQTERRAATERRELDEEPNRQLEQMLPASDPLKATRSVPEGQIAPK